MELRGAMKILLTILLLAQVQTSHFVRPPFPRTGDLVRQGRIPKHYAGEFTVSKSGKWTLDYRKFYDADYTFGKIPVSCAFRDRKETGFSNKEPIYDVDESYDHITLQAKVGSHWWYECKIAAPK
jgi:hypothetical protein